MPLVNSTRSDLKKIPMRAFAPLESVRAMSTFIGVEAVWGQIDPPSGHRDVLCASSPMRSRPSPARARGLLAVDGRQSWNWGWQVCMDAADHAPSSRSRLSLHPYRPIPIERVGDLAPRFPA